MCTHSVFSGLAQLQFPGHPQVPAHLRGQTLCVSVRHAGTSGPRPTVSTPVTPSSSIGVSVRYRRCPAGPAGPAQSRRSAPRTWWPRWPRPCRSCPPASGMHSPATSDVSTTCARLSSSQRPSAQVTEQLCVSVLLFC